MRITWSDRREMWSWEASRAAYWLGLPWKCKLRRHVWKLHDWWNGDAHAYEEKWIECERCGEYGGHTEYLTVPEPNDLADRLGF
jgi:hypothetical protein